MNVNEDEIHKLHPYVPEWHTYTKVPVLNSKPTHDPSAVKPTHVCRKRVCKTTKEQNLKMRRELLSLKEEIQNLKHELEQQEHIIVKLKEDIENPLAPVRKIIWINLRTFEAKLPLMKFVSLMNSCIYTLACLVLLFLSGFSVK